MLTDMKLVRLGIWLLTAATLGNVFACDSDEDCNLNGLCDTRTHRCECDPGWKSPSCGELDLRPAKRNSGYNLTSQGTSSWGSKIVRDPHTPRLYHLFLAEFTDGCGLDYWSPYSRIIRAESCTKPDGPYHFAAEVVGAFAHNPTVVWSPADHKWLMYYIGCQQPLYFNGTCLAPSFSCGPGNTINGESGISIQTSSNLRDWTFEGQVLLGSNNLDQWDADVTNPSPLPLFTSTNPTSEILLTYRGCPFNCSVGLEQINLAIAPHFKGPYTKIQADPVFPDSNEDPFIWRDKRGHFHMLLHSLEPTGGFGDGPNVGRHAYARNFEGPWTFDNKTLAFSTRVMFEDGLVVDYFRRERPQLYFSEDGQMRPLYLTTGVQEVDNKMSYTIIQPVAN